MTAPELDLQLLRELSAYARQGNGQLFVAVTPDQVDALLGEVALLRANIANVALMQRWDPNVDEDISVEGTDTMLPSDTGEFVEIVDVMRALTFKHIITFDPEPPHGA